MTYTTDKIYASKILTLLHMDMENQLRQYPLPISSSCKKFCFVTAELITIS